MVYILFAIGFPVLIKSADLLISGASSLARKFNIPDIIIGLTIIAFGTSAPELFVNILGSIRGNAQIAIGNILGSNIFNILIVLGVSAIVAPLTTEGSTARKEIPLNLLAIVILGILANGAILTNKNSVSSLSRLDGAMLLLLFFGFFAYLLRSAKIGEPKKHHREIESHALSKGLIFTVVGLAELLIGAEWIVGGAVAIAKRLGLSQFLISSTIIAGGTSLPELAASVAAITKRKSGIAVSNVIGSNIFNIFFILGISALIRPLPVKGAVNIDIGVAILVSVLLLITMLIGKKKKLLGKWQGIMFICLYIGYVTFLIMRG